MNQTPLENQSAIDAAAMQERLRERYEAIGARNERLEQESRRARRRTLLVAAVVVWVWCLAGLAGIAAAIRSSDSEMGWVWFWGGLVIGNGGILATFVWTFARLRARGDE